MTPDHTPNHSDVLILGGGLAGLAAADELRTSELSVTVLEASQRLGGRTFGEYWEPAGRMVDMGGTWLLPSFSESFRLLDELSIGTVESPASDIYLTHFRRGVENRQFPSTEERKRLELFTQELHRVVERSGKIVSAEEALAAAQKSSFQRDDFSEDWHRATQRYLAGADLTEVDAAHLLLDLDDIANPEHYRTQIAGTTDALINALSRRARARFVFDQAVISVIKDSAKRHTVTTHAGERFTATAVIMTLPLNVLSSIEFSPKLSGALATVVAAGHVGASRKDWYVLTGVEQHFRVYASHGPYGYFRSEAILDDGAVLAVGLTPSSEGSPDVAEINESIKDYFPDARVRAHRSHNWITDPFARGAWFVPRPGQYAALSEHRTGDPLFGIAGGDFDEAFPGTIEGALASGRRAAQSIHRELTRDD